MRLTIIEPHEHFGVLMRWIQVSNQIDWHLNIITSQANWKKIKNIIPEDCAQCQFYELFKISPFPKTDFLIFTSMQASWWYWIKYARKYPSALIIHNGNTYFRPFQNLARRKNTRFNILKYSLKWLYEKIFSYPIRRDFLKAQNFVIPFSSLQTEYFKKYSKQVVAPIQPRFSQFANTYKKPVVLLYLYNRLPQIDRQFLKKQLLEYKLENYTQLIVISTKKEYKELQQHFDKEHNVNLSKYPLPSKAYFKLLRGCKYVCLPFKQERIFNIFNELIGITKYSGRIRDALEFGCEVHMPDYIPREKSEDLPTIEAAAQQLELQLTEMYDNA